MLFSAPQLKNEMCLIALVRHIVLSIFCFCFCVYATDAIRGQNGESGLSENPFQKTTESRNRLEEFPSMFSALAPRGLCGPRRIHALQLAKLAPQHLGPSTSSPTRLKRRRHLDIGVRPRGASADIRKDKQRAVEVGGRVKFLALSTIIALFATILVACSFYSFATVCFNTSKCLMFFFSTDFGALPGPRPIAPRDDIDISLCVYGIPSPIVGR